MKNKPSTENLVSPKKKVSLNQGDWTLSFCPQNKLYVQPKINEIDYTPATPPTSSGFSCFLFQGMCCSPTIILKWVISCMLYSKKTLAKDRKHVEYIYLGVCC